MSDQIASIKASITPIGYIKGKIKTKETIGGVISVSEITQSAYPHFVGSYTVTPETDSYDVGCEGCVMDDDITVQAIPYYETSNEYGTTVKIGG